MKQNPDSRLRVAGLVLLLMTSGILRVAADWTPPESSVTPPAVVTLDAFAPLWWDGGYPSIPLTPGPDGALYGSSWTGGIYGHGTLFRQETNGTFTILHQFNTTDGDGPSAPMVVGPDGALYGSTSGGGYYGYGTLFRLQTNGVLTKLHEFNGNDGAGPYMTPLVVGPDGALYGSTEEGGTGYSPISGNYRYGTLFRLGTNGNFTKLHEFNGTNGAIPGAALVVGPDGAFYGSTFYGGIGFVSSPSPNPGNLGYGTLFRLETNGTFTELHEFDGTNGAGPEAALVIGPDNAMYAGTSGGGPGFDPGWGSYSGNGTLFRLQTNGDFTKLHEFIGTDGANADFTLALGPDGALYGPTSLGGPSFDPGSTNSGNGTLFRLETDGSFTQIHSFDGTNGAGPGAALVLGPDGALYGSTYRGGVDFDPTTNIYGGFGTLFRIETNGTFTKLQDFNGSNGRTPETAMVVGKDGALYGPTVYGGDTGNSGYGYGTLFRLETSGAFARLHEFSSSDGVSPQAALAAAPDGALYGSASSGGVNGSGGTLFRLETSGIFTKLRDFDGLDGSYPTAALVPGTDGAMYGSCSGGGTNGYGTLFRLETDGAFTKLHDFDGSDGAAPTTALVAGSDGALYGSTSIGGDDFFFYPNAYGTLFRVATNGTFESLHSFNGTDGLNPSAPLVVGPDGAMYGSTYSGGPEFDPVALYGGYGTLFRIETNGAFTTIYNFQGSDGSFPYAPLVVGADGALYGSTSSGGASGDGTLFRLETNGTLTTLFSFTYADTGSGPSAPLLLGPDGALYGSAPYGGANDAGTLFRLETDGTFTNLHDFKGDDGRYPLAAMVAGLDGALYGSTQSGGAAEKGTLYRLETNGNFTKLFDFNGTNGSGPQVPMVQGPDASLYGSTPNEGPRGGGILYKIVLNRPPVAQCRDVTVSAQANCSAPASIDNGSFDPDAGDTLSVTQTPPGPYPVGTNLVVLTVTDNHGASDSCSATVTVVDDIPPQIVCPTDMVVNAESPAGTVVSFQPVASDSCTLASVSSTPPSGSTFPIGTTTVTCQAVDAAGLTNTCTFTIRVVGIVDSDGDGVPDAVDQCPDTPHGAIADTNGCSIDQLVPCEGPLSGGTWKNHGEYVVAVIRTATDFLKAGVISRSEWVRIVSGAARSHCGWNR